MMWTDREVKAEQLSDEWFKSRYGCLTASIVGDIMPGARGGVPKTRETLLYKKTVEYLASVDESEPIPKKFENWGHEFEEEALQQIESVRDIHLIKPGLVKSEFSHLVGASCDGITADGRLTAEVKCPYYMHSHIKMIEKNPVINLSSDSTYKRYYWQPRMQMLCTGAEWAAWCSYHPLFEPKKAFVVMIQRDEDEMDLLKKHCLDFVKDMKELSKKILEG